MKETEKGVSREREREREKGGKESIEELRSRSENRQLTEKRERGKRASKRERASEEEKGRDILRLKECSFRFVEGWIRWRWE